MSNQKTFPQLTHHVSNTTKNTGKCKYFRNSKAKSDFFFFLHRVATTSVMWSRLVDQRYSYNCNINDSIKKGKCCELILEDAERLTCFELAEIIGIIYNLDDIVVQWLVFVYHLFIRDKDKKDTNYIEEDDEVIIHPVCCHWNDPNPSVPSIKVTYKALTLKVRVNKGEEVQVEVLYNL